jgi:quinol monooxygenase YgiN
MSVSFLAAGAATIIAAVVTGILVWRFVRLPRLDQAAWVCAAAGLTVALAAQALGYHQGFNAAVFRAMEVGARLAAPMALVWGLAELTGKSFAARFGARLALGALTAIAGVILASDPLSGVTFTTAWPTSAAHYQFIPNVILVAIAVATVLPVLVALVVAGIRARREAGWRDVFPAVAAAAAAALLTQALQLKLPVNSGYAAICLIAVVLAWFAGWRSGRVQLTALHEGVAIEVDDDTGWGVGYNDDTLSRRYRADTGGYRRVGTDSDFSGLYRPDSGGSRRPRADSEASGRYQADTGGFEEVDSDTGYGFYRTDTDLRPVVNGAAELPLGDPVPGVIETGDILPVTFDVFKPAARGSDAQQDETARLYGQIAIYTLIDGQAEEFDRLAQAVVERVKALEPDTLAYIVHGVPSAPLQRILYEVYRDDAAFEEHGRQPYIQDFEEERKPYVLATNVIELGVRQAKLSPLGGPSYPPAPAGTPGQRPPASPSQRPPSQRPADQRGQGSQPGPAAPRGRTGPHVPPGEPGPQRRPGPVAPGSRPGPGSPVVPGSRTGPPGPMVPGGPPGPVARGGRTVPPGEPGPQRRPGPVAPGSRPGPGGPVAPGSRTGPPGAGRPDSYGRPGPHGRPGGSAAFPAPPDGESPRSWSNGIQ